LNEAITELVNDSDENVDHYKYVLITPARNEAGFIEQTIKSVINQTVLPLKWVIVSDGSTDGTDEIVKKYTSEHRWIELLRKPERAERNFAGKVYAFNAGYESIRDLKYDVIGNLDADISFEQDYLAFLLSRFAENPKLGVGGTPFMEGSRTYDYRFTSIKHVSGICQLFRRECFEAIGGYKPIKGGGIDLVAVTTARMKGWETRTFTEKVCIHLRTIGTGKSTHLAAQFRFGKQDYYTGGHPLWEIFRAMYQMKNRPYILGGGLLLIGFYWAMLTCVDKSVTKELEVFRRREQMQRLKAFFNKVFRLRGP
jgi:poly-beta-1,6-N-acetyl-D-glucosamine synthase